MEVERFIKADVKFAADLVEMGESEGQYPTVVLPAHPSPIPVPKLKG